MIASRNLPQRAASTSLLMRADEKLTLSTPFGSCNRASCISLLEEDDNPTTVPEGEISATSPSRRRSTRRGLHRAASISVLQKDGKASAGKTSEDNGDDETGPESPSRAVSRSLKRAASVSTLGKDANQSPKATGGRTRTALVRTQSKRSLSRESSARRLGHHSPTHKKAAPLRSYSGESLDRLVTLSEDEDDSSDASDVMDTEEPGAATSKHSEGKRQPTNGSSSSSSSAHRTRRGSSSHHSSPRRKSAAPRPKTTKPVAQHDGVEKRITSLEDELVKARSMIASLQQQQQQSSGSSGTAEAQDDVDDDASAYQVTEVSGRKFGKLLGGVLGRK